MKKLATLLAAVLLCTAAVAQMPLQQSTASQAVKFGPFVDDSDGKTAEVALTIANTDVKCSKNGGSLASKNSGGGTHDAGGWYTVTFDATDTNTAGRLQCYIQVTGALPVFREFLVYPTANYAALFSTAPGASGGLLIAGTNADFDVTANASFAGGVTITQSTSNTAALVITGNGTGNGATITSGSGATGDGLRVVAASTNGNGYSSQGVGTGSGDLLTGGATGHGLSAAGGATSGNGIRAAGTAGNSAALNLVGQGSAAGLLTTGGATGHGIAAVGGATSGSGLSAIASTSGSGIVATGVGTTQAGIAATGGSTSSAGISATGGGTGSGILATSGAGSTGNGITATAASTNGNAFGVTATGTGLIFSTPANVNVTQYGGSAGTFASGRPEVNLTHIAGSAVSTSTAQLGVNVVNAAGTAWGSGAITAASIATDAIGAAEIGTDAISEIQSNLSTLTAAGVRAAVGLASANLDTQLIAIDDYVDTEVAAIKIVTDRLDSAMELDSTVYRFTSNALEQAPSGSGPSAATIADAVWDEVQSGHTTTGTFGKYLDASVSGVSTGGVSASDIADAVWDEALSGHTTGGTSGERLARIPNAAAGGNGGLPTVNASNQIFGLQVLDEDSTTIDLDASIWSTGTRRLSDGTNIVLAKGTGVTGFNDLDAAATRAAIGLASANLDTQLGTAAADSSGVTALVSRLTSARAGYLDNLAAGAVATAASIAALNNLSAVQLRDTVIEDNGGGITLGCAIAVVMAYAAGDLTTSGASSTYKDPSGTETRITGTVSSPGNRAATVICPSY